MPDNVSPVDPSEQPRAPAAAAGGSSSFRLVGFALLGAVTLAIYPLAKRQGAGDDLAMVGMGVLGALWATVIVADTAYHAWRGAGYACLKCGHRRRMTSFRIAGPCPKCGE
ncbi:MAG: hypothetical protein EBR86_12660 [Planctomycetia bacterium]|nr:hypothetical protein [Planctomycetia bacterium]